VDLSTEIGGGKTGDCR